MTQVDERLARLETKVDLLLSRFDSFAGQIDGKVQNQEIEMVRMKSHLKALAGVLMLLVMGGGGLAGVIRLIGV